MDTQWIPSWYGQQWICSLGHHRYPKLERHKPWLGSASSQACQCPLSMLSLPTSSLSFSKLSSLQNQEFEEKPSCGFALSDPYLQNPEMKRETSWDLLSKSVVSQTQKGFSQSLACVFFSNVLSAKEKSP